MIGEASSSAFSLGNLILAVIWFILTLLGGYWSREFIKTAIRETQVTKFRIVLLGILFLACGVITGAADIGAIAFGICTTTSVFLLNPIYCREQQRSDGVSSYVGSFTLLMLIFVIGLAILPTPELLPGRDSPIKVMMLYTIIGVSGALFGPIIKKELADPTTDEREKREEDNTEQEDSGREVDSPQQYAK
jgi:hypothetical protein